MWGCALGSLYLSIDSNMPGLDTQLHLCT